MLEKPGSKNGDGVFRQAPLRPPGVRLQYSVLLRDPSLPQLLVDVAEAAEPNAVAIFVLSEFLPG